MPNILAKRCHNCKEIKTLVEIKVSGIAGAGDLFLCRECASIFLLTHVIDRLNIIGQNCMIGCPADCNKKNCASCRRNPDFSDKYSR